MNKLISIAIAVTISGCSFGAPDDSFRVDYQTIDLPREERLELVYTNETTREVCFYIGDWPNETGKMSDAEDRVFLHVDGIRYSFMEFNTGYCPYDCQLHVEPGEELKGTLYYEDFDLPVEVWGLPKELEFLMPADYCD